MDTGRELLNKYLSSTGTSQSELARRAGLHSTAISKLAAGLRKEPDLSTAIAIDRATEGAVPATSWIPSAEPDAAPDSTGTDG